MSFVDKSIIVSILYTPIHNYWFGLIGAEFLLEELAFSSSIETNIMDE
jgi:hypothetical protein